MIWKHLEQAGTTWNELCNHLEQVGTIWNHLERDGLSNELTQKDQEIYRKELYMQCHCSVEYNSSNSY